MSHQWEFRLSNRLPALADFSRRLEGCLAAAHPPPPEGAVFAIGLLLDEWLTNVIKYGHPAGDPPLADGARDGDDGNAPPPHPIEVRLTLNETEFEIEVRDDGVPFDLTTAPPRADEAHLSVEDRQVGGWGLDLLRRTADHIAYRREGDHNVVTLRKRLTLERQRPEG